jgi:Protein of unknown function (DUF3037)
MPEKHLFEYAVIRLVPKVEREEFLNIGVILYAKSLKYLQTKYHLDEQRLQHFSDQMDLPEVQEYLEAFDRICRGADDGGPIGKLDMASRFRWLTATRSTIVQTSKVHSGFCTDPEESLNNIYLQLVG